MRGLWLKIRGWWWARQRAADVQLLWPALKAQTPSLEDARAAFMVHAVASPCWDKHYAPRELVSAVWRLS